MEDVQQQHEWRFSQVFGEKLESDVEVQDSDVITAVEFDERGQHLATGDRGGRIVIFQENLSKKTKEYKFLTEFQSHEPEFDYLKSLEIEEKINKIRWCKRSNPALFLLSTNDKTIKLWKVHERQRQVVTNHITGGRSMSNTNGILMKPEVAYDRNDDDDDDKRDQPHYHHESLGSPRKLRVPRIEKQEYSVHATLRRSYQNAHAYHINSLSLNSDGETFISADDLRINLWNLNISDQSFNIVDIKPTNMEELTEVITAAEFHPSHCNYLMYSNSKGIIRLLDTRMKALCDHDYVRSFQESEDPSSKSFFSEIISSISDMKFSRDGRYIVSRDYLTLKVWDWNMNSTPVKTILVHEFLRSKLCDLYENDCIFDKFECSFSGDARHMVTGSYNNHFRVYNMDQQQEVLLHADRTAIKAKRAIGYASTPSRLRLLNKGKKKDDIINPDMIDFSKKILHLSYHPREDTIAVAGTNNLYICTRP